MLLICKLIFCIFFNYHKQDRALLGSNLSGLWRDLYIKNREGHRLSLKKRKKTHTFHPKRKIQKTLFKFRTMLVNRKAIIIGLLIFYMSKSIVQAIQGKYKD